MDPRKSLDEAYILSRNSSERSFRAPTARVLYEGWFDVCRGDVLNLARAGFRRRYVVVSTSAIATWKPVWAAEVGADASGAEAVGRFRSMPARLKEACQLICDAFVLGDEVPLESVLSADLRKTARSDFTFHNGEVRHMTLKLKFYYARVECGTKSALIQHPNSHPLRWSRALRGDRPTHSQPTVPTRAY